MTPPLRSVIAPVLALLFVTLAVGQMPEIRPTCADGRREPSRRPNSRRPGARKAPTDSDSAEAQFETADRILTVKPGPRGPIYTVSNRGSRRGRVDLTRSELRDREPELWQLLKSAPVARRQSHA